MEVFNSWSHSAWHIPLFLVYIVYTAPITTISRYHIDLFLEAIRMMIHKINSPLNNNIVQNCC